MNGILAAVMVPHPPLIVAEVGREKDTENDRGLQRGSGVDHGVPAGGHRDPVAAPDHVCGLFSYLAGERREGRSGKLPGRKCEI
jgi:hypothetical protein